MALLLYTGLLACYYQPRADDLLGTYYYQSVSSLTADTERHMHDAADTDSEGAAGDGVVVGLHLRGQQRVVVRRRLLVLAAVCLVLAAGVTCRLLT